MQRMSRQADIYIAGVPAPPFLVGINDLLLGFKNYRLWTFLGWQDIRQRYRRSILGPFWITLSTGVTVLIMSLLYGRLFHMPMDVFAPFLSAGMIIWAFMLTLVNEGCSSFMAADGMIKQVRLPLSLHVMRVIWRNFIIFLHNIVILVPVWFVFGKTVSVFNLLVAILGLLLIAVNALWSGMLLGALCARYRDIPPIVGTFMQAAFFITPIMWLPSILQSRGIANWLVVFNPFYHLVQVIRAPLLGEAFPVASFASVTVISVVGMTVAIAFLGLYKKSIPYWL